MRLIYVNESLWAINQVMHRERVQEAENYEVGQTLLFKSELSEKDKKERLKMIGLIQKH